MEHLKLVPEPLAIHPGHQWAPTVGEQLIDLLQRSPLDEEGRLEVSTQAVAVLAQGVPPAATEPSRRTGLVVGFVQSGKTLSFTSVIALANDNRIPLVILLTGTKKNLHEQTYQRLRRDLQVDAPGSPWLIFTNPKAVPATIQEVSVVLKTAQGSRLGRSDNPFLKAFHRDNRTVVVTVTKNAAQMGHMKALLEAAAKAGVELGGLPVLVIDDEADQAGLNTRANDEEDPGRTYAAIRALRATLPQHTYIEYTATPQAPLLLNMLDTLAPDYVAVLKPGKGYTGGEYFFGVQRDTFVEDIPQAQADQAADATSITPPESLEKALAAYVVSSLLMGLRGIPLSSMLVHPSQAQGLQHRYAQWVTSVLNQWRLVIEEGGPLRDELVEDRIMPALLDLQGKVEPDTLDSVVDALPFVTSQMQVRIVNSGTAKDSQIAWDNFPFWILVGGNKLDRGYTVEGLVTTYMPRGTGGQQADTIQQRARFLGYKSPYADLCRAWLTKDQVELYVRYVEHERALRDELARVAKSGENLKEWRRKILIDPALKPCRANVIGLPYTRARVKAGDWMRFERLRLQPGQLDTNRKLLQAFLTGAAGSRREDARDPRSEDRNTIFDVDLTELLTLIARWEHHPLDGDALNAVGLVLGQRIDERPGLRAQAYFMRDGRIRERGLAPGDHERVVNLHEGYRPGHDADAYPGDAAFRSDDLDTVSVQFFRVNIKGEKSWQDVPALALYVPRGLAADVILGLE